MPNLAGRSQGIHTCSSSRKPPLQREGQHHSQLCPHDLHVPGLVGDDEGGGEAVLVVEGAAAERVAHPRHRSVAWGKESREGQRGGEERENL